MMRHADSEESGQGRDHDRPITEAGRRAAEQARNDVLQSVPMLDTLDTVNQCASEFNAGLRCVDNRFHRSCPQLWQGLYLTKL